MIILGIDPGLAEVGWGILEKQNTPNSTFQILEYGCLSTSSKLPVAKRLQLIYDEVGRVIKKHQPDVVAIESLFFGVNAKTAMLVGQARGTIILACNIGNLQVFDYTPLQIKTAVTGYGRADKNQVQQMVKTLLKLKEVPKPDHAADALACAYCHFVTKSTL